MQTRYLAITVARTDLGTSGNALLGSPVGSDGVAPPRSPLRISAVLVSTDLEASQRFYEEKVGMTLSPETIPNHLLFDAGDGTTLLIYGRPTSNLADHTQVRFWSTDIETDVKELADRGITFDDYDTPTFKTENHIATTPIGRSAWFKDPDGNTIAIFQPA